MPLPAATRTLFLECRMLAGCWSDAYIFLNTAAINYEKLTCALCSPGPDINDIYLDEITRLRPLRLI